MPELPPEQTLEEKKAMKLAVAENALTTAGSYKNEASYYPEGSVQRTLLEGYATAYEHTAKALFEVATR